MSNLSNKFEALWQSKDSAGRGRQFERLFCELLYKNGFEVQENAGSARPRQTDIFAERDDRSFLFELKWQKRRLDVSAIAQIRDRLRRVPRGIIGCICSMSGYTEKLISDIERDRHEYEVLLFNPHEIYGLFKEELRFGDLVAEKRRSLRQRGIAWFSREGQQTTVRRYMELPASTETLDRGQESLHFRLSSDDISDIVFVHTPLIFDEYITAFSLRVQIESSTTDGIREALGAATNYLGMRGGGRFGIRQSESGWYGFGGQNFLREIDRYAERYKGYKGNIHHSEELVFFEELNQGLFLLTARQRLRGQAEIHSAEIRIRLPGIPADTQPYLKFIRSLGNEALLFVPEQPLARLEINPLLRTKIHPADVVTVIRSMRAGGTHGSVISGLVIKNPFFRKAMSKRLNPEGLGIFAEPECLICTLDDWLDVGDEVDSYFITRLEWARLDGALLLHPRCTWRKLLRRVEPDKDTRFRQFEAEWNRRQASVNHIEKASERRKI